MLTWNDVVSKLGLTGGVSPLASGSFMKGGLTDREGSTAAGVAAFAPAVEQWPRQLQNGAPASAAAAGHSLSCTQSRAHFPTCVSQYMPYGQASSKVHARGVATRLAIKSAFLGHAGSGGVPPSDVDAPTHWPMQLQAEPAG